MDTGLVQVFNTDRYSSSKSLPHSARYSVEEAGKLGGDLGSVGRKDCILSTAMTQQK